MTNVIDEFKGLTVEEIKTKLKERARPFSILMESWQGDFNIGTCIRNANAFCAREVFYIGKKRYDKRGAVGVYNYTDVKYLSSFDDLLKLKDIYTFVGVDNIVDSIPVEDYSWSRMSLLIFGEEGCGLTPEMIQVCDAMVKISQWGSVRSLNAGTASGIIMYDFVNKIKS